MTTADSSKEDLEKWHRYFAVENNNRAWDLAAQTSRTDAECEEMMHAAHTSNWHWKKIGTELHHIRADMLLAEVHALLGYGASSLRLAEAVSGYFMEQGSDDWEIAFVHTIYAHAAAVAGAKELHDQQYELAREAIDSIADDEDREIVLATFNQVPEP